MRVYFIHIHTYEHISIFFLTSIFNVIYRKKILLRIEVITSIFVIDDSLLSRSLNSDKISCKVSSVVPHAPIYLWSYSCVYGNFYGGIHENPFFYRSFLLRNCELPNWFSDKIGISAVLNTWKATRNLNLFSWKSTRDRN